MSLKVTNNMNNVLIFGAYGQLGNCLKQVSEKLDISNIILSAETEANILEAEKITALFEKHNPAYCINCAAYTAVDKAEDDIEIARKVNKDGAANLALACKQYNATLIQISTDFVFEGKMTKLLNEEDEARPVGVYGLTKLEGEQAIIGILKQHYILRTSWLYSEFGNNFVKTMLKLGAERDELKVVTDQIGTPTYAIDLAETIMHIIKNDKQQYGVYHYSNEGVTSWYDFAKAIFDISGTDVNLMPVKSSEYVTRAARPVFSVMDKSKIKNTFGLTIPYWRDSLVNCINILKP